MSGLVQSLSVNGSTETKSDSWSEELVVGKSSDSVVIDFGLTILGKACSKRMRGGSHLDEGGGVKSVLACNFDSWLGGSLSIP